MEIKHSEFWSNLFLNSQDEKLIAHAQAEYYRSLSNKTSDLMNAMALYFDGQPIAEEQLRRYATISDMTFFSSATPSAEDDTTTGTLIFSLKDNPGLFNILNDDSKLNNTGDYIEKIEVVDAWGNHFFIDIDSLMDSMGFQLDQADIIASGYEAIDREAFESFYNKMNATYKETSIGITTLIDSIGANLSAAVTDIRTKLATMDKITSMDIGEQIMDDGVTGEDILKGSYAGMLRNATGSNPVLTMLNGLADVNWGSSFTNAAEGIINVTMIMPYRMAYVGIKAAAKVVGKAFKWLGNLFKKTFVDPVDYSVTRGDTIQYTKSTSVFSFAMNPETELYHAIVDAINVGESCWFSLVNMTYRITRQQNDTCIVEQWVKPTSPEGLRQMFAKYGITDIRNITYQQLYDIYTNVDNLEPMVKKSDEVDVFRGLQLSQTLSDLMMVMMYGATTMYQETDYQKSWNDQIFETNTPILEYCLDNHDTVLGPETWSGWSSVTRGTSECTPRTILTPGYDLFSQFRRVGTILNLYNSTSNDKYPTISATGVTNNSSTTSRGKGLLTASSVTNYDFVKQVSLDPFGHYFGYNAVSDSFDQSGWYVDNSDLYLYYQQQGGLSVLNYKNEITPNFIAYLMSAPYRRKKLIGSRYQDQAFLILGYSTGNLAIEQNLEIHSDKANTKALTACLVGALVVAGAIIGLKTFNALKGYLATVASSLNNKTTAAKSLVDALPEDAPWPQKVAYGNAYRKAVKKQNRFKKIFGSYGFTSGLGLQNTTAAMSGLSLANDEQIMDVITG